MLDLSPATIRTWETRYARVVPQRSQGGQRLYSRDQVDQLRFVKARLAEGRRPAEAHRLLADGVASGASFAAARMRILLAESQFGAAELLRQLLGSEGFEVVVAADPETAAQKVEELAPTLAVVDTTDARFGDLVRSLRARGARILPAHGLLQHARSLAD
jgi:DNA-binding transcriptional MerR regulator